jgi:hypothetical protein
VRIRPAIAVILSIRSTVTIVEALATVAVVVSVASGLLGGRWDSKGTLQLFALPHGVLSITVELALVVHDHIEGTFEEGGRSWWICYIGFVRSLARPGASVIVVFSVEVMHYRILWFICSAGRSLRLRTRRSHTSTQNTENTVSLYWFGPPESNTLRPVVGVDCLRIAYEYEGSPRPPYIGQRMRSVP